MPVSPVSDEEPEIFAAAISKTQCLLINGSLVRAQQAEPIREISKGCRDAALFYWVMGNQGIYGLWRLIQAVRKRLPPM
jgi:hypothetical protein